MNENKHKSCHSWSENILIEHSTVQWLPNQPITAFGYRLSMYNAQRRNATAIATTFLQTNFTKTKAIRVNLQREIKKTIGLTIQFGSDASNAALERRAWSLHRGVWTIFLPVLQLSCSSLICGKSQCMKTGNQCVFTGYNSGVLQNAIQQPPFCLFIDLLVLVDLIAY